MSFMETPPSYVTVNKHNHFTSRRYKQYYTSGFFSIEAAINAYVLGELWVGAFAGSWPLHRGSLVDAQPYAVSSIIGLVITTLTTTAFHTI
jgi:hypothetical protein